MSTCSGERVWSRPGRRPRGSATTRAIRSRRCWVAWLVRPRVIAYGRTTGPASSSNQWLSGPLTVVGSIAHAALTRRGGPVRGAVAQVHADPLDQQGHLVGDLADVGVGVGEDGEAAAVAGGRDEEEGLVELDDGLADAARLEVAADALGEAVEAGGDGGQVLAVLPGEVLGDAGRQSVAGEHECLADAADAVAPGRRGAS